MMIGCNACGHERCCVDEVQQDDGGRGEQQGLSDRLLMGSNLPNRGTVNHQQPETMAETRRRQNQETVQ